MFDEAVVYGNLNSSHINVDSYVGCAVGRDGRYDLPDDLRIAVEKAGESILDLATKADIDLASLGYDLDDSGDGITIREAGAVYAVAAMRTKRQIVPNQSTLEVKSVFTNFVKGLNLRIALTDEERLIALHVYGDNWPEESKRPTNTAEADKNFIDLMKAQADADRAFSDWIAVHQSS